MLRGVACLATILRAAFAQETCDCPDTRLNPVSQGGWEESQWRQVDLVLERYWNYSRSGYTTNRDESDIVLAAQQKAVDACPQRADGSTVKKATAPAASTYGEVTPRGVRQLARLLELHRGDEAAFFADLGMGTGKVVVQMYLENPRLQRVLGVELLPARAAFAKDALQEILEAGELARLRRRALLGSVLAESDTASLARAELATGSLGVTALDLKNPKKKAVTMEAADMYDADLTEVTHAYLASLTWCEGMLRRMASKLTKEAPKLKAFASLKRIPDAASTLPGFVESDRNAQMSWTKRASEGTTVYVYSRTA